MGSQFHLKNIVVIDFYKGANIFILFYFNDFLVLAKTVPLPVHQATFLSTSYKSLPSLKTYFWTFSKGNFLGQSNVQALVFQPNQPILGSLSRLSGCSSPCTNLTFVLLTASIYNLPPAKTQPLQPLWFLKSQQSN